VNSLPPLLPGLASHSWAYPALEVVHLIGLALLLGNLVLVELRIWGAGPRLDAEALARLALPLVLGGFALMALSGLLMFATQPGELLANRPFVIKLLLVTLAGCNAVAFHLRGGLRRADALARAQTALSLGLWVGAIICGRWIAYV
jgi:hypothetical protein